MNVYRGTDDRRIKPSPRSIAIGVFDGVHRGHQRILRRMLSEADRLRARSMVITFDPHPSSVLHPRRKDPVLMSLAHRLKIFETAGTAETLILHFNKRMAAVSRERFLQGFLLKELNMKSLIVGYDFCFGRKGLGDLAYLRAESRRRRFRLSVIPALKNGRQIISSTRIRKLVEEGRFEKARKMLGRSVSVYGTVVRGRGRGKSLGFPTANLNPHHETLPPGGVYAAYGFLGKKRLKGVVHIGRRPTFGDAQKSVEVYFLDFRENIYGRELELVFIKRLRGTQKFQTPAKLQAAIREDIRKALNVFRGLKSA